MATSNLTKFGIISGVFSSVLGSVVFLWVQRDMKAEIDPRVEKACYSEVAQRTPLGHRALTVYSYQEESSNLAVASGGVEAQYAPNKWTQALWTCRVNPTSRRISRVEFLPTHGGNRLRSAASAFK